MLPLINSKSKIWVDISQASKENIALGDIVVVFIKGKLVAHRVIYLDKENKSLTFKGDTNSQIDGEFKINNVIGIVTKIKSYQYVINLESNKNRIFKYLFVVFSRLTLFLPFFLSKLIWASFLYGSRKTLLGFLGSK